MVNIDPKMRHEELTVAGTGFTCDPAFSERVRINQLRLKAGLKPRYDFIVCGAGSSGSVVARRLAENPDVSVLLLEAGGNDEVPSVTEASHWPMNLGSERDWAFQAQPSAALNGRSIPLSMGKVLGGGSSINVMVWARGHRADWDHYATVAGQPAWNYRSVVDIYRRIENWHGAPDPDHRGVDGPVFIQPPTNPNPLAPATLDGAHSVGIPVYDSPNGRMMEAAGGVALTDMNVREGKRQSIFRSYTYPVMDQPNLTVLTHALVLRVTFQGRRASGVELMYGDKIVQIEAGLEIVLSLGAIQTPKLLLHSGIGDASELRRLSIPVKQHLPGVGQNFQDHVAFDCVWEYRKPQPPRNTMSEAFCLWNSEAGLESPDILICQAEIPKSTAENVAKIGLPDAGWTLFGAVARPRSRGRLRLTGPSPADPVQIEANTLTEPEDYEIAKKCIALCREIGNSPPLRPFAKREVMPGALKGRELDVFIRDAATSFWHATCTARMGRDEMSVVDGDLRVYGIDNLRIADGSILPRITTGNTMAPCVVVGERAGDAIRHTHRLKTHASAVPATRSPIAAARF